MVEADDEELCHSLMILLYFATGFIVTQALKSGDSKVAPL